MLIILEFLVNIFNNLSEFVCFQVGFGKSMATPVVWLGNLAETVHEGFLCKQFSRFGALSHTVVDKENHRGLVFFLNPESAQYALPEMRNRIWNGKKIHVSIETKNYNSGSIWKLKRCILPKSID